MQRVGHRRGLRCERLGRHTLEQNICQFGRQRGRGVIDPVGQGQDITFIVASRISLNTSGSTGLLKSIPETSAPKVGPSSVTWMC